MLNTRVSSSSGASAVDQAGSEQQADPSMDVDSANEAIDVDEQHDQTQADNQVRVTEAVRFEFLVVPTRPCFCCSSCIIHPVCLSLSPRVGTYQPQGGCPCMWRAVHVHIPRAGVLFWYILYSHEYEYGSNGIDNRQTMSHPV